MGFQTFDNIIDESYDQELDPELRFKKAFDQVLHLCQQDQATTLAQVKPITQHNYNLFRARDWRGAWQDSIKQGLTI